MPYAEHSKVPVGRSREEIEQVLKRAGAEGFANAQSGNKAYVAFVYKGIGIKIKLTLPDQPGPKAPKLAIQRYEKNTRAMWRRLLLVIKAKVESIESGIETFEQAFLPHILLKNGDTVGERTIPALSQFNQGGDAKLLLGI
jgi:hypothetical protein